MDPMNPEDRLRQLESLSSANRALSEYRRDGGLTSLMFMGFMFASGAFVTKCLLKISHKAEHMSDTKQYSIVALGGLIGAAAIARRAYRYNGMHPLELIGARRARRHSKRLEAQHAELSSWLTGPNDERVDEAVVKDFRSQLDELG